jgi:hypothetical protein
VLAAGDLETTRDKRRSGMFSFKFMTDVTVKDLGCWDVTPCSLVLSTEIFKSNYHLNFKVIWETTNLKDGCVRFFHKIFSWP